MAGLSQKRVAKLMHFKNTNSISQWEKGASCPSLQQIFRLSLLYKTVPMHLYFELWQSLKEEMDGQEQSLCAQDEPF